MKYLVLDIETTGLDPETNGITEITAILYDEKLSKERVVVDTLTAPGIEIPMFITNITRITNEMVEGKPGYVELLNSIVKQAVDNNWIIVAHHAHFEKKYFRWNVAPRLMKASKWICTRANHLLINSIMDKILIKNSSRLKQCAESYGYVYNEQKAHRARYDVELTATVLKHQLESIDTNDSIRNTKNFIIECFKIEERFKGR